MSTSGSNGNGTSGKKRRKPKSVRTRGAADHPDAITLLEIDHRKLEALFAAYADTSPRQLERKWLIVTALRHLLAVHSTIEEEIFYPALCMAGNRRTAHELAKALQEHHVSDVLLAELRGYSPEQEQFDAKVEVLDESIERHLEEEETELFVEARRRLSAKRLVELGVAMELRRTELTGVSRPAIPTDATDTTPEGAMRLRASLGTD